VREARKGERNYDTEENMNITKILLARMITDSGLRFYAAARLRARNSQRFLIFEMHNGFSKRSHKFAISR
jgi:hypothetical protein